MARILVADDEQGLREFIADTLAEDGHHVVQAGDGAEAAGHLAREAFDLVITDLRMPKLDGLALLARVRGDQPDVEVIVLTAHGSVGTAVTAMKQGAFDFLEKPIESPDALQLLVGRALERRTLVAARDRAVRDAEPLPPLSYGDPAMTPVAAALRKVSPTNATVLLLGETGVGKEVAARTIHAWSRRTEGPFVAVNCAAIAETLLESELFGHEKGAFTGATAQRRGRIELAAGGTFFLDEIGDMKPELQTKLLRVLQERRFERVGGTRTIEVDVRWIAATNRDVEELVETGGLREDLYHRIAGFPVRLPALRERRADIVPLAETLLAGIARDLGRARLSLDGESRQWLAAAPWPGNIRELANTLERAAILAEGPAIRLADLRHSDVPRRRSTAGLEGTLGEIEHAAIERALAASGGNRREAAEALGIGLRTLYEKLRRSRSEMARES